MSKRKYLDNMTRFMAVVVVVVFFLGGGAASSCFKY